VSHFDRKLNMVDIATWLKCFFAVESPLLRSLVEIFCEKRRWGLSINYEGGATVDMGATSQHTWVGRLEPSLGPTLSFIQ
jgi:hypothetical protein